MTTRDTGGVRIHPDPATTGGVRQEADLGVLLTILFGIVSMIGLVVMLVTHVPDDVGWNVDYAKRAAASCPPISGRIDEMLADGRVTDDEQDIIRTLVEQARAAPGGLEACPNH